MQAHCTTCTPCLKGVFFMADNHCPYCGRHIPQRQPTNLYTVKRASMGAALPDYDIAEFVTPARAAGVGSDVAVPLWQSAISGLILAVLSVWPVTWFAWSWFIPVAVGGVTWSVTWFLLLREHRRSLWQVETYQQERLAAPAPAAAAIGVKLQVQEDDTHFRFAELPIDRGTLGAVARAVANGRSFTVAGMTGRGKPLSRSQYETLREWLFSADYARWVDDGNHASGVEFTAKGRAFWRALAER